MFGTPWNGSNGRCGRSFPARAKILQVYCIPCRKMLSDPAPRVPQLFKDFRFPKSNLSSSPGSLPTQWPLKNSVISGAAAAKPGNEVTPEPARTRRSVLWCW